jgi:crotonobetainyl-CoA:carnitine CoA-transferase CaiB-like acyl-CoA transferase
MDHSGAVNNGPLAGVKVVEMGHLIAGPFCGQLMGDMGAEVVKIEPPGSGDPMRAWGRGEFPLWWEIISRNKLSVSADVRLPEGQALARRLIAQADILIENFRPGTLEKWGLAPDNLHRDNPGLIIVRVSGYGQTGPYSERAGFGGIGEAMGGWRYIVGEPDRPPSRMGISIGDTLAGTFGCLGALAALQYRSLSGMGQVVDSSLYESVLQVMEGLVPEYAVAGLTRERSGSILPGIAPSGVYRCIDGEYLIGANQDSVFARLCQAMGKPDLAQDQRYCNHLQRGQHQKELDQIVEAWTRQHTIAEVERLLIAAGVPAGKMYRAVEMLADPHFVARESIVDLQHPRWGSVKMQNVFPKLSLTPGRVRTIAPQKVGEHNHLIYGGRFGLTDCELDDLAKRGVI